MWKTAICFVLISYFVYTIYIPPMNISSRPYLLSLKLSALNLARYIGKLSYFAFGFGFLGRTTDSLSHLIDPGLHPNEYYNVEKIVLDGVPADIISPRNKTANSPAIFYLHGGGWVQYTKVGFRTISIEFAMKLSSVVVLLDYPLAPEHPYPIPFEACTKALIHFIKFAEQYGVDSNKIILAGDSAGGNLAAAVSIKLASMKELPQPKLQVLIYPAVQILDFNTPSYQKNKDDFLLPKNGALKGWLLYMFGWDILNDDLNLAASLLAENHHIDQDEVQRLKSTVDFSKLLGYLQKYESLSKLPDNVLTGSRSASILKAVHDPYLSPLTGASDEQLKSVPPVYLLTCTRDILRDEGVMYKQRLERAGNRVLQHDEYDFIHGLVSLDMPESVQAINKIIDFIRSSKLIDE